MSVAAIGCLWLTGCAELFYPLQKEGRDRVEVILPERSAGMPPGEKQILKDEWDYIRQRREKAGIGAGTRATLGVAFSGGGIRSATINLGSLQGLEDGGLLPYVDYLSCVSGGGYIGGWYVSHLRTPAELTELKEQGLSGTELANFSSKPKELLNLSEKAPCAAVPNLRDYGGLFGKEETLGRHVAKSSSLFLATLPLNFVQDAIVHLQPAPGKWNSFHPVLRYRYHLEEYYLQGWHRVRQQGSAVATAQVTKKGAPYLASDINSPGSPTPYFISNGAMANSGPSDGKWKCPWTNQMDEEGFKTRWYQRHHFEFTRQWCGSPALGWLPTRYFGRSVANVERRDGKTTVELLTGPFPGLATQPFRLSTAMAASGAAVDAAAANHWYRRALNGITTIFNFNLRYQTSNFAQDYTRWYERPVDRLRETTLDRNNRTPRSNTIQISDGGHFDNLGVYALLRRGVEEIISFDASKDPEYKYGDLRNLLKLIVDSGGSYEISPDQWMDLACYERAKESDRLPEQFRKKCRPPVDPIWRFKVLTRIGKECIVYYVKASYRPEDATSPEADDDPKLFPPNNLQIGGEKFPHISTFALSGWGQQRFDAYRDVGRYLARRVVKEVKPRQ